MRTLCILTLSIAFIHASHSATFCATNAAELQSHLTTAETNGQADVIRIARGTYSGNFVYNASNTTGADTEDLTIIGGYVGFAANACGLLLDPAPSNTVLDGNDVAQTFRITPNDATTIVIRNLSFINGNASATGYPRGGGLCVIDTGADTQVYVENNLFTNNTAALGSAINVSGGFVVLRNNVVVGNYSELDASILVGADSTGVHVINNTIVGNSNAGIGDGGIRISTSNGLLVNNILWGNANVDLRIYNTVGSQYYVYNNSIENLEGLPDHSAGNVSVAPQFEGGIFNFTLVEGSPLIDAGRKPPRVMTFPPAFDANWSLPETDLTGRARVQGVTVDIGAEETRPEQLFTDGFE